MQCLHFFPLLVKLCYVPIGCHVINFSMHIHEHLLRLTHITSLCIQLRRLYMACGNELWRKHCNASIPHLLTANNSPNFLQQLVDTIDACIGKGGNNQHNLVKSRFKNQLMINTTRRFPNAFTQTKNTKGNHIMIQNDVEFKTYGSKQ
jgi:hypothetical protein